MPIVQTTNLCKTFRSGVIRKKEVRALNDVSLAIDSGQIFGLLGPNGAGKTTFVKILLSITFPSRGDVQVLGHNLGSIAIREKSGYLPENHRYPLFLTGLQTLMLFGELNGLKGLALRDRALSLLSLVGLKDWAGVKIRRYSKGMMQRLGLAQALLNEPELLFLDEPTDGVDPIGRKEIRDLMRDLRAKGSTIFLNSHMLSEVEAISDRVAILNKGEVLKVGTIDEITAKQLEYEFQLSAPISDDLQSKLRTVVKGVKKDGDLLVVAVDNKVDVNRALDILRADGVLIESLTLRKSSLEESFIDLIKSEER